MAGSGDHWPEFERVQPVWLPEMPDGTDGHHGQHVVGDGQHLPPEADVPEHGGGDVQVHPSGCQHCHGGSDCLDVMCTVLLNCVFVIFMVSLI